VYQRLSSVGIMLMVVITLIAFSNDLGARPG
jgi:hypothetical protein